MLSTGIIFVIVFSIYLVFIVAYLLFFFSKKKIDKKYYKIVTDGKEFRIKFPSGMVGCHSHLSIEEAKKSIDLYYRGQLPHA